MDELNLQTYTPYCKVLFDRCSYASGEPFKYKENEVISGGKDFPTKINGFHYATPDKILRSLIRGTTIYKVIIPQNAVTEEIKEGVFRANKITILCKRKLTDDDICTLIDIATLTEKEWTETVPIIAIYDYPKALKKAISLHLNKKNVRDVAKYAKMYLKMGDGFGYGYVGIKHNHLKELLIECKKVLVGE